MHTPVQSRSSSRHGPRWRVSVLFALVLSLAPMVTLNAATIPRLPTGAADWATFNAAERKAALDYEWRVFQADLAAGTAVLHSTSDTTSAASSPNALTTTVTYACPVQWYNQIQGSWVRGGGWTDSSASMSTIYASQPGTYIGKLYKDGTVIDYWYTYQHNTSHVESWTAYNFKWWFESIRTTSTVATTALSSSRAERGNWDPTSFVRMGPGPDEVTDVRPNGS